MSDLAPVSHWVVGGDGVSGEVVSQVLPEVFHIIPAGGVIKRFQVRNNLVLGQSSHEGFQNIPPCLIFQNVVFFPAGEGGRVVFTSTRQVTSTTAALFDPVGGRIYSRYHCAGDDELGVNQQCSYGRYSDTSDNSIVFRTSIFGEAGDMEFDMTALISYEFAVLYQTQS